VYLGFNTLRGASPAQNPLRDRRVRLAIAQAVDREALLRGPLADVGAPANELVPRQVFGSHGTLLPPPSDPAASRGLLSSARARFERPLFLDWEQNRYPGIDAVVVAIGKSLQAVGVPVALRPRKAGVLLPRQEFDADVDLYVRGWLNSAADAGASYGSLSSYSNPEVDRELAEAARPGSPVERRAHLTAVARIVHDDVAIVPLYRQVDRYAYAAGLEFQPRLDRRIRAFEMRWGLPPLR
jgi:peptide/nickel transport system substrate-binding protein